MSRRAASDRTQADPDGLACARRLWPSRLHQQLVLTMALLVLGAVTVLGAYTAHSQSKLAREGLRLEQSTVARHLALSSGNLILTERLDELEELARRTAEFPDVRDVWVLDAQGRALTHIHRDASGRIRLVSDAPGTRWPVPDGIQPQWQEHDDGSGTAMSALHPVVAGDVVGWVRVDQHVQSLVPIQQRILISTAVVGLLAVVSSTLLLMVLVRPSMRALNRAARFASDLMHTEGQQLPVPDGPREIRQLSQALNQTSRRLSEQIQGIESVMLQLEFHETQLSQQNEQLQAIFALSPDGLAIVDDQGHVTFVNEAFTRISGLPHDDLIDRRESELEDALMTRLDPESLFLGLADSLDGATGPDAAQTLRTVDQPPRVLGLTVMGTRLPSVSKVIFLADLTRQHELDQMKSEFLSMAAHELRTPMASIFGFTELMLRREMSVEQRKDLLSRMHRQSQVMINILNELLDLARIESRRGCDFVMKPLELGEFLEGVLAEHVPPEGRQPPMFERPDFPMMVRADADKLRQALSNVLSNAYKYSPDGGDVQALLVARKTDEGQAQWGIEITDHGMGLKPEELARMGERFFRADKSGNIPGTGLGVSIMRELVALMGGETAISSEYGQGTTVTIWLPQGSPSLAHAAPALVGA